MAERHPNLPTHDAFGRKLPMTFKSFYGKLKHKEHDPTGDEVRVTVFAKGIKLRRHTFRNLKIARGFIEASTAVWKDAKPGTGPESRQINQRTKVEFGDGRTMTLKVGDEAPKR